MKRTNLGLDEQVLEDAKRLTGAKTCSVAVNLALVELVRQRTFARVDTFASSGIWDGDLGETRADVRVPR